MKKWIALVLVLACVLGLVGCNRSNRRSIDDIIANEPYITGVVKEITFNSFLIENENGEYWVSRKVENRGRDTSFGVGDEVTVYYDGNVTEGYPMQITTVYAIAVKVTPVKTENDQG